MEGPVPKLESHVLSPQTAISLSLFFAIAGGVSTISYQMGKSEASERESGEIKQEIKGIKDALKALEINIATICANTPRCVRR